MFRPYLRCCLEFYLQKIRSLGAGGYCTYLSTLLLVRWSGEEDRWKNTGDIHPVSCSQLLLSLREKGRGSLGMWGQLPFPHVETWGHLGAEGMDCLHDVLA